MAIPLDRATTITNNAANLSMEYLKELAYGVSDERRKAIDRDMKLIRIIVKAVAWPYRHEMKKYLENDEDLLELFGLN